MGALKCWPPLIIPVMPPEEEEEEEEDKEEAPGAPRGMTPPDLVVRTRAGCGRNSRNIPIATTRSKAKNTTLRKELNKKRRREAGRERGKEAKMMKEGREWVG